MGVLCVIQARLGSHRLPQKALMDIGGRPLIAHVVERAQQIQGVDDVVLAVPCGQVLELAFCPHTSGPDVPEDDVLARFAAVAEMYPQHETILRITGDCPLLNPLVASAVLTLFQQAHAWYAWNVYPGYTDGEDVEVFRREALMRAHREATSPEDREHVTPFLRRHYAVVTLKPWTTGKRKTSVDDEEDLAYVRSLYAQSI